MAKKLTQEEFIARVSAIFGDSLDFSRSVFKGRDKEVEVVCPVHGTAWHKPCYLYRGHGCKECGKIKCISALRTTKDEFIRKSIETFGEGVFDYSQVEIKNTATKVKIRCIKHDTIFEQIPSTHYKGDAGCPLCKKENKIIKGAKQKEKHALLFLEESDTLHGGLYDYSLVEYKGSHAPVKIVCKIHGVFEQSPTNHLFGRGCPACSKNGFDPSAPTVLYILSCEARQGIFTGYGLTKDIETRIRRHELELGRGGFSITQKKLYSFLGGDAAKAIEDALLEEYPLASSHSKSIKGFKRESTSAPFEEVVAFVQKYLENREGS